MASWIQDSDQIQPGFLPFGLFGKKFIFSKANQITFAFFNSVLIICIVFSPISIWFVITPATNFHLSSHN